MRWYTARLFRKKVTGKDRLGVEQVKEVECGWCTVRVAPVHASKMDETGNTAHFVERNFITMKPARDFQGVTKIETRGKVYELKEVTDLENGQTMLNGIYYKPEVNKHGVQLDVDRPGGIGAETDFAFFDSLGGRC